MENSQEQIKIFIAYSHEDVEYLTELRKHIILLERSEAVEIWYDGKIVAGKIWDNEIKKHLQQADIILLLISANSLHSSYFHEQEMKKALVRHEQNTAIVIPVILSACLWKRVKALKRLEALPKKAKPISSWQDKAEAYTSIGEGIWDILPTARGNKARRIETAQQEQKKNRKVEVEGPKQGKSKIKRNEQLENYMTQATTAFEQGNYDNCIWCTEKAIEIDSNNIEAQQLKNDATKNLQSKERKVAIEQLKEDKVFKLGMFVLINILAFCLLGNFFFFNELTEREKKKIINTLENNMIKVQGGAFLMGCDEKRYGSCQNDEKPVHEVTLDSYKISKYEVTQIQWLAIMNENRSKFKGCHNCPVERVSWDNIQVFLKKLNSLTGKNFRLPTEAEWEYAAKGGNKSKNYKYAGSNNIDEVAWYDENSYSKGKNHADYGTHEVGSKGKANELGLYDMSGNLYEWCEDWYDSNFYENKNKLVNNINNTERVLRGGSWCDSAVSCQVVSRKNFNPDRKNNYNGFRLAHSL